LGSFGAFLADSVKFFQKKGFTYLAQQGTFFTIPLAWPDSQAGQG